MPHSQVYTSLAVSRSQARTVGWCTARHQRPTPFTPFNDITYQERPDIRTSNINIMKGSVMYLSRSSLTSRCVREL